MQMADAAAAARAPENTPAMVKKIGKTTYKVHVHFSNTSTETMSDKIKRMAWRKDYAPHTQEDAFHPRFVEALQKQAQVEYLLDVLLFGETEEKAVLIMDYGKDVIQIEQRMAELAAADAARTKKHHERHAAAPER